MVAIIVTAIFGYVINLFLVFGSPVSRLENDRNWTGLGLIGPQIPRTATDRNRSPVLGLYIFGNI
jgi:hypothetical protein